jgi:hypothetical protein
MRVWRWGRARSGKSKKTFGLLIRSCLALWWRTLRRRSQKHRINWTRTLVLATRWLHQPRALHPFPDVRFAATHPRLRTGCANHRPSGSVRGATRNGCPYRAQQVTPSGAFLCHTQPSVDHGVAYSEAVSSSVDRLRWPCNAVVRLARKARGVASGDEAEAATSVATLVPEVCACLVSFDVRARSVSRIEVSPPNCD